MVDNKPKGNGIKRDCSLRDYTVQRFYAVPFGVWKTSMTFVVRDYEGSTCNKIKIMETRFRRGVMSRIARMYLSHKFYRKSQQLHGPARIFDLAKERRLK